LTNYLLSEGADRDLKSVWDYIADAAADQWLATSFDVFEMIAQNLRVGHERRDLTAHAVSFCPINAYLIIYRVKSNLTEIVAATQGGRDIPAFLDRRL
jgi:plasmid stabilization system protein ParE